MTGSTVKKKVAKKKVAKKKAAAKKTESAAGILETIEAIKAEVAQEYAEKEATMLAELEQARETLGNHNALAKRVEDIQGRNRDLTRENQALKNDAATAGRLQELEDKEASINEAMRKFEEEREANVNEIVNTRTERMKAKIDEELAEKAQLIARQVLIGQDVQTRNLYHEIVVLLQESKAPPVVINQSLDLVKQTLLHEVRTRLGVDAKPEQPEQPEESQPPVPPTPPSESPTE